MNITKPMLCLILGSLCLQNSVFAQVAHPDLSKRTKQDVIDQWQKDRFGIFIHWGASSILNAGAGSWCREDNFKGNGKDKHPAGNKTQATAPEVITSGEYLKWKGKRPIPQEIYDNLHHVHNPTRFDANEWAQLFKDAGAGYIVFTAKHHDGFCNFDTKTQDYKITNTPFKRDICKELVEACRAEGIRVFWYYSPVDWWHPDWMSGKDTAYEEQAFLPQVEELVSNYGPIEGIWWDGNQITKKYADKVVSMIKEKQPWALLNPRLGGGAPSDFSTPEQKLGEFNMDRRWESCITMTGSSWFWNGGTNYKTTNICISTLVQCVIGDGNLLLDFGPKADGTIDQRAADTYRAMGAWLNKYGAAVRGTRGGPYKPGPWGGSTRTKDKVYLHVLQKIEDGKLSLPPLGLDVTSARCLNGGEVKFTQTEKGIDLEIPKQDEVDLIVELAVVGDALALDPIVTHTDTGHNVIDNAELKASSIGGRGNTPNCLVHHDWEGKGKAEAILNFGEPGYEEQQERLKKKAKMKKKERWANNHIGHPFRFWQAGDEDKNPWIEVRLSSVAEISQLYLWENHGYVTAFAVDAKVNGEWQELFTEKGGMGVYNRKLKNPVGTAAIRIRFTEISGPVSMNAIKLFK